MKILFADDKKNWHILFENVLKERNIKVLHAYTPKDAVEKISQERPNVVILDMTLRDGSALDVLPSIVKERLPVIVIGYKGEGLDEEKLKSYGASRVLQKPFTVNELLSVLEELGERTVEHEEEEKLEIVLPEEATISPSEPEELEIIELEPEEEIEVQPEQLSQVQEEQPVKEEILSTSTVATSTEISKEELKELLKPEIENIIREIVWEVVPEIAEKVIREEIERLIKSRLA
ncbi:response regulator [Desulfurobacterium crinifex]